MRRDGKAILVVSGELEDLRTCDRVLVMRHGGVVAEHKAGWSDNALVASIEGICSVTTDNDTRRPEAARRPPSIGGRAWRGCATLRCCRRWWCWSSSAAWSARCS